MRKIFFSIFVFLMAGLMVYAQESVSNEYFSIQFGPRGITTLKRTNDTYETEYIRKDQTFGDILIRFRMGSEKWQTISTAKIKGERKEVKVSLEKTTPEYIIRYDYPKDIVFFDGIGRDDYDAYMTLTTRFRLEDDALFWTFHFRNLTDKPIEIGDIALPLPFNTKKGWNKTQAYTKRLIRHSFISRHGSFIYWMRPNSVGPYLVMIPLRECPLFEAYGWHRERNFKPTKLEYFENQGDYNVFIHSAVKGARVQEKGGNWRLPHTSAKLMPKYTPDDGLTYGFKFRWAEDYDEVRDILYEEGLFDVHIVPGMTVPVDLHAMFSLRTKNRIKSIVPEFPEQTRIEKLGEKEKDTYVYRVRFSKLGENMLTINYGKAQQMVLEFFVTEPLETMIKKHAAFLIKKQIRNPDKWYDGLFADWDMEKKVLCTPDRVNILQDYWKASNDPSLSKAPFIAEKNFHYPSPEEIKAIEYYLENFVWGKLQRTDKETYPYGIYGTPNWKLNRESKPSDRRGWTKKLWRLYDYPHIIMLYFNMYRIAKHYPWMTEYLDKNEYLERAFGTAKAYFTIPYETANWSPYQLGIFNELVIPNVIDALYMEGMNKESNWLKEKWEAKVKHFINDRPNYFHSEFAFGSCAFESTHAFSKYAIKQKSTNDKSLEEVKSREVSEFMEKQIKANIALRGWLETSYYRLGSSGSLTYMSQMGGWSIVDYALYYSKEPEKYLRLGYASFLSSWALMNTGTPESSYGYWYPGKENDGAAGSRFIQSAYGHRLGRKLGRGVGPWDFESALGFCGALRTAATIVTDDLLFGLLAYGGQLTQTIKDIKVIPRDGLRKRFHVIREKYRFHMLLDTDGFAEDKPIIFDQNLSEITFNLENRIDNKHKIRLKLWGLPVGSYQIITDNAPILTFASEVDKKNVIWLPVKENGDNRIVIKKVEHNE